MWSIYSETSPSPLVIKRSPKTTSDDVVVAVVVVIAKR